MIQRIAADDERVTRLGSFFQPATLSSVSAVGAAPDAVDPEVVRQQLMQDASAAGHAQGLQQGMQQAETKIRDAIAAAEQACLQRHTQALEALVQQREQLAKLAQQLPQQWAAQQAQTLENAALIAYAALTRLLLELPAAERIAQMCQLAVAGQAQRPLTLRCAPDEAPLAAALELGGVQVEADARLQPGQCRIETPLGTDDAGLDVRLDMLRTAFLDGLAAAGRQA
jgi:flagellar assembly protein FliH